MANESDQGRPANMIRVELSELTPDEGLRLIKAFASVSDPKIRDAILAIVEKIASAPSGPTRPAGPLHD